MIPKDDVAEFLGVFARFEFALKQAGFGGSPGEDARPHWEDFAAKVAPQFDRAATVALTAAVDYLIQNPPRKPVIDPNGNLVWALTPAQVANKLARIVWAVWARDVAFRATPAAA